MADDYATRVMWPFPPNWAQSYTVSYEFRTDIFTSDSGLEQRRALRTTPRKSIDFTAAVANDKLRQFNRIVDTTQNLLFIMPELTRWAEISLPVGDGATTVSVSSVPAWLVAGAEVILNDPVSGYTLAVVSVVFGNQVTFGVSPGARPAGTRIYPALTGRLPASFAAKRRTSALAQPQVTLDVVPTSEFYPLTTPSQVFGDYEILIINPSWGSGTATTHEWPVEIVDLGRGRTTTYEPIQFPTTARTFDIVTTSADDLVAMFVRMRGQRGTFWASTYEPDMIPAAPMAGTTIDMVGTSLYLSYHGDPVRAAIEIYVPAVGTWRTLVTDASIVDGNTRLTLSDPLPALAVEAVARISWLTLARFASDTLKIEYVSPSAVRASVSIRTLPGAAAQHSGNLRVTVDGSVRDTQEGEDRAVIYL